LQLRASYASKAPPYSVPDTVQIVDALPKLVSGKVDRLALARLAEEVVL
jgi:acyl-coenzyme A synthetase/AMP-(fatty) acid ligase